MNISVYLPLLVSVLLAAVSPILVRWLGPARAGLALVLAASTAAVASTWALVLLAATLLPEAPVVAERTRWSQFVDPVPDGVGGIALAMLAVGLYRAAVVARRRRRVGRELRALCVACSAAGSKAGSEGDAELVVAPTDVPHAFAVSGRWGRGGRILVSVGMLKVLNPAQRRAMFAHERAHLVHRHHVQRAAVEVAAALNPLLIPARDAVAFLVERSADEHAAMVVDDRQLAARTLALAALARTAHGDGHGVALAYQHLEVSRRVAALGAAPLPEWRLPPAALLVLGGIGALAAADATVSFLRLVHVLLPGL